VEIDPWGGPWIRIHTPGCPVQWWNSSGPDVRPMDAVPPVGRSLEAFYAESKDGTRVPFVVIGPTDHSPRGLLIVGYGAYGMPTGLGTGRWEPLLKDGWAVAIGLWRGGGDHTPEWEDAGRVHGRIRTLEDAEAVVREARRRTGVPARATVVYGRSAGGLWVGGLVAKYPDGDLFGGAYMEVPYLDVLRTVTNRTLPLTEIETEEFGLPEARLSDFASLLQWSPMELLLARGQGGRPVKVWQLVRTGANDSEVYPYESAKWVARCGERALLAFQDRQGHFVSGAVGLDQRALDLAILQKKSKE
jgi:protease II